MPMDTFSFSVIGSFYSFSGHDKVIDTLLRNGANIHAGDKRGQTVLFPAAFNSNLKMLKIVI